MHALPCCKNASRRHLSNLDHFYHHSTVMHPSCWCASSCGIFSSYFKDFILVKKKLGDFFFVCVCILGRFCMIIFSFNSQCDRNPEVQICSHLNCFVIVSEIFRSSIFLLIFVNMLANWPLQKKRKCITTLVLELHNFDRSKLHIEIMLAVRIEILF